MDGEKSDKNATFDGMIRSSCEAECFAARREIELQWWGEGGLNNR